MDKTTKNCCECNVPLLPHEERSGTICDYCFNALLTYIEDPQEAI